MNREILNNECAKLREELNFSPTEPIVDIFDVCKKLNIEVKYMGKKELNYGKEASVSKEEDKWVIQLNKNFISSNNRLRFTLAHEIAHIRLGHLKDTNILFRDAIFIRDNALTEAEQEKEVEANYFAGEFLLPVEVARKVDNFTTTAIKYMVSPQVVKIKNGH